MTAHERRIHLDLREIFEEAYLLVLPFLDPVQGFGRQPLIRQAYIRIHETYPELTPQEVAILVPALQRVYHVRTYSCAMPARASAKT